MLKECIVCKEKLTLDHFWKQSASKTGTQSYCKTCQMERNNEYKRSEEYRKKQAEYREKNRETSVCKALQRTYSITLDDYRTMLEEQGNVCKCCGLEYTVKRYHVDHCHETGKIRGLLCDSCNRGLGFFGDKSEGVYKGYLYLKRFEENV